MILPIEIPLGISEDYDLLPQEGEELEVRCQDCDKIFIDQLRKFGKGPRVLAVFCPADRARRRMCFAAPLPAARARKGGTFMILRQLLETVARRILNERLG